MGRTIRPMAEPERIPRVHVLEIPVVWFLLQLVEYGALILILRIVVPEDWPLPVTSGLAFALLVAVVLVNYRIRRRFIPH
jgi:hypothetical protein